MTTTLNGMLCNANLFDHVPFSKAHRSHVLCRVPRVTHATDRIRATPRHSRHPRHAPTHAPNPGAANRDPCPPPAETCAPPGARRVDGTMVHRAVSQRSQSRNTSHEPTTSTTRTQASQPRGNRQSKQTQALRKTKNKPFVQPAWEA